jgi:NAD(P)-dependent dehydrogenase (short-subunit alcohol dehydrogenase family)
VIGGTSGIGRAIALALAESGVDTVATGRRPELVASVASEIEAFGVRTLARACDAESDESVNALRDVVAAKLGGLDILINAAGRTIRKPALEITPAEWTSLQDTNVTTALRTSQAFFELLKVSGKGRIINIASLSSFVAFHEVAAYSASKAAILSLTKSFGQEWSKFGIRTNAIVPGVFITDINRDALNGTARGKEMLMRTPMGRFGDVQELVGTALFLASDAASFITGTSVTVDGGYLASGVNS